MVQEGLTKLIFCILILVLSLLFYTFSRPVDRRTIIKSCGQAKDTARYFITYHGGCYHRPKQSMTWYEGLRYCLLLDLKLATLDEQTKLDLITQHCVRNRMHQEYWFGGTNLGVPGEFWFIANGKLVNLFQQNILQANASEQLCLKLNVHFKSTNIASETCHAYHPVICESVERHSFYGRLF
ncbi:uncharacterized protein [Eurosta solidaginis]|uniref:uncharacterized protein n=1 Tax=Eurosta solidaginis TaxID=178769 RepID=UPI0035309307